MSELIEGWSALESFSEIKKHHLQRAIAHYAFPAPRDITRRPQGRLVRFKAWDRQEVDGWLNSADGHAFLSNIGRILNKSCHRRGQAVGG